MGEDQPADNQSPTGPQADARGDARVTVREAARLLGLTVEAVRGRIKRGTLEVERTDEGVFVWLDREISAEDANQPPTGHDQPPTGPQPDARAELVESLLDQVAYMRRQLAEEREANRENRRLLAAALERIPAIEAPEPRDSTENATEGEPGTETPASDTGEPRPSWWRRFFGFE